MECQGSILLADDEEVFLEATHDLLEEEGFSCSTVRNAQELSSALNNFDYDLLITDLNMPGNRVLEMVDEIRSRALAIPVIIVTGYPSIPSAVESVRLNVLEYLIKPIDYPKLLDVTRRGVQHKQILRSVRRAREEVVQRADQLAKIENTLSIFGSEGRDAQIRDAVAANLENRDATPPTRVSAPTEGSEVTSLPYEVASYVKLREGLHEAIDVLQKTKGAFRSKVLADLRQRLQKLLKETSVSGS